MVSVTLKTSLAVPQKVNAEAWHESTTSLAGINPREMKTCVLGNVFGFLVVVVIVLLFFANNVFACKEENTHASEAIMMLM